MLPQTLFHSVTLIFHHMWQMWGKNLCVLATVFWWSKLTLSNTWVYTFIRLGVYSTLPLKAKVAGSWAVVQQRHSQLQCGNTVNLKNFLLQSIVVPSLHYGCELWGMHTPCGVAQKARVALQSIYDRYLRHICGVKYATPSAMFLEELGFSPLHMDELETTSRRTTYTTCY